MRSQIIVLSACLGIQLVTMMGCEEGRTVGKLRGTISFQSEPVENAKVLVRNPITGASAVAILDDEGGYMFKQPLAIGVYYVSIQPIYDLPPAGEPGERPVPGQENDRKDIPLKYRTTSEGGLKTEIFEGENVFEVDLGS